jgi:hypothetical protein
MRTFVNDQGLHSLPTLSDLQKLWLVKELTCQGLRFFLAKTDTRP